MPTSNSQPQNANVLPQGAGGDPLARYYQLDERVTNLRSSVSHLETQMQTGFAAINGQLHALNEQLRQGAKTQWPVVWSAAGVVFAVLAGIGAILYTPIKSDIGKLEELAITRNEYDNNQLRSTETRMRYENMLSKLADTTVTKDDLAVLTDEYRDYKTRIDNTLGRMDAGTVTRAEWTERNRARDVELADVSRRIDELQKSSNAVYGARDIILDMKRELDDLRDAVQRERRSGYNAPTSGPT